MLVVVLVVMDVDEERSGSARDVVSSCIVSHPAHQDSEGARKSGESQNARCTVMPNDGRDTRSVVGGIWGPATKPGDAGVVWWSSDVVRCRPLISRFRGVVSVSRKKLRGWALLQSDRTSAPNAVQDNNKVSKERTGLSVAFSRYNCSPGDP